MKDLVTMIGRMGDVIPKIYERDLERAPTDEELFAGLQHPSLKRMFMEMMTNSKEILIPIFSQLENGLAKNLDDYEGAFDPINFKLEEGKDGQKQLVLRPEVIQRFRDVWAMIAEKRATDGKTPPRALQCPVLYTGKFIEMYDWVASEYQKFYEQERLIAGI
jgi:hypothetical protein